MLSLFLFLGAGALSVSAQFDMSSADADMMRQLYTRDAEDIPGPMAYGAKYISG